MKSRVFYVIGIVIGCVLLFNCTYSGNSVSTQVHYYYWPCNSFSKTWIPDSSNTYSVEGFFELKFNEKQFHECQTCDGLIEVTLKHPWQDNIIEIVYEEDCVRKGTIWTTSDEIDFGRENYNSGQCVVPIDNIRQEGDTLFFTIDYNEVIFFSNAIDIDIRSSVDALSVGYKKWINNDNIRMGGNANDFVINYRAIVRPDSLLLSREYEDSYGWEKRFEHIDARKLKKIQRSMPNSMEQKNSTD